MNPQLKTLAIGAAVGALLIGVGIVVGVRVVGHPDPLSASRGAGDSLPPEVRRAIIERFGVVAPTSLAPQQPPPPLRPEFSAALERATAQTGTPDARAATLALQVLVEGEKDPRNREQARMELAKVLTAQHDLIGANRVIMQMGQDATTVDGQLRALHLLQKVPNTASK